MPLIEVQELSVAFHTHQGSKTVVDNVSFSIEKGEILALVGESGSGKTLTALSLLRLLPYPMASHPSGQIMMEGTDILALHDRELHTLRGNRISMIFQEPMTSLNPLHTIGKQLLEAIAIHNPKEAIPARVMELLHMVGLENFKDRLGAYPHELSGGQRQRVMIAMALANRPSLLIADEPTTALDVTLQQQILNLLLELRQKLGMAILLITHDLSLVRHYADKVCVMKSGQLVEHGSVKEVFAHPQHPYTQLLLSSAPKGAPIPVASGAPTIMKTEKLSVRFPIKKGIWKRTVDYVDAVKEISLSVKRGETLGIVGESGSGKTTLANALLRLGPSEGTIHFNGIRIDKLLMPQLRQQRKHMQVVFQDPFSSLNPRMSVEQLLSEGLLAHGVGTHKDERDKKITAILERVGLDASMRHRYPHEFSGGQRQRIAIARALILEPSFLVLDEPTSALDMTVQAHIVDLLRDLQTERQLGYIFISHDLRVIKAISHYVMVMRNGQVVEHGNAEKILNSPEHPYTKALIEAAFHHQAA